jgi:hypothetical protein
MISKKRKFGTDDRQACARRVFYALTVAIGPFTQYRVLSDILSVITKYADRYPVLYFYTRRPPSSEMSHPTGADHTLVVTKTYWPQLHAYHPTVSITPTDACGAGGIYHVATGEPQLSFRSMISDPVVNRIIEIFPVTARTAELAPEAADYFLALLDQSENNLVAINRFTGDCKQLNETLDRLSSTHCIANGSLFEWDERSNRNVRSQYARDALAQHTHARLHAMFVT